MIDRLLPNPLPTLAGPSLVRPSPPAGPSTLRRLLAPLASLRLTVILLGLAMLLIFAGTWAQLDASAYDIQKRYFHSLLVWVPLATFRLPLAGGIPLPGGYTIGLLLLANLLAAHTVRFHYTRKHVGIILIHLGVAMLLVGEGLSSVLSLETQMPIDQGSYAKFTQDLQHAELAVIDPSSPDHDLVTVVAGRRLADKGLVHDQRLPFDVTIDDYFPNSRLMGPQEAGAKANARATAGVGVGVSVQPLPPFTGASNASKIEFPTAYVTLSAGGKPLGTYLVSTWIDQPQDVSLNGKLFRIQLRFQRYYKPYTLHLIKFSHDVYLGTNDARNYASLIRLEDPSRGVDRQVRIWMNHPLRYHGETFYQASFLQGDRTTVLEVVKNPGWPIPYIACIIGGLGLLIHFGATLLRFLRRRRGPLPDVAASPHRQAPPEPLGGLALSSWFPAIVSVACLLYLISAAAPKGSVNGFDLDGFGALPILDAGRVQPLDSLARNSLRIISSKDAVTVDGRSHRAIEWLADSLTDMKKMQAYPIFRIDHPDILGLLNLDPTRNTFSYAEIAPSLPVLKQQYDLAQDTDKGARDTYQRKILELGDKVKTMTHLIGPLQLYLVAPAAAAGDWQMLGPALDAPVMPPAADHVARVLQAYADNDPTLFNLELTAYRRWLDDQQPGLSAKARFEAFFNRVDPFYQCMLFYVVAFVLAILSWVFWARPLRRAALWVLVFTLAVHTLGLVARIYIQGRPPVTNLYSSAIFIAWGAVVLALVLESIWRNGTGIVVACMLAFPSLLIAHYLAADGDTMKQLEAVLNTNIWLATHVVVVTLGYASTFLAGTLAIVYTIRNFFLNHDGRDGQDRPDQDLVRMTYGIVCFAMLFSFVGTILGGIWADQSWGRFWGWDPKENGAVLIVLWNALILHARWGGIVRARGFMLLAIFGNVVTSWSWFGTNMLGVGLHSYGFMDKAVFWLAAFVICNLALILAAAVVPRRRARSLAEISNLKS